MLIFQVKRFECMSTNILADVMLKHLSDSEGIDSTFSNKVVYYCYLILKE